MLDEVALAILPDALGDALLLGLVVYFTLAVLFIILPASDILFPAIRVEQRAFVIILLAVLPLAFIATSIGPVKRTLAVFLVVSEVSFVLFAALALRPLEDAVAFFDAVGPQAGVLTLVRISVGAITVVFVLTEVAVVLLDTIRPGDCALALTESVVPLSVVNATVGIVVYTLPVPLVVVPVAVVSGLV